MYYEFLLIVQIQSEDCKVFTQFLNFIHVSLLSYVENLDFYQDFTYYEFVLNCNVYKSYMG